MRIALIGNDHIEQFPLNNYGGIETCVENLALGLNQLNKDFFVITPKRSRHREYDFEIYETEEFPTSLSKKSSYAYAYSAAKTLSDKKFDIIWSQSNWSIEPLLRFNKPIICTFHDSSDKIYGWIKRYPNVRYRFISKFQYNLWVKDEWEKDVCFWAYTGLTRDNFCLEQDKDDYFLWCAGLNWGLHTKGLDYFINIARNNKQFKFLAYGSGGDKGLEDYLRSLDKDINNFYFNGPLKKGEEHTKIFKNARGFFMPTRLPEAFGRTIIESFSKGTPVFGSKNGALEELIEDGVNGFKSNLDSQDIDINYKFNYNKIYEDSKIFSIENEISILEKESLKLL